jgi:hypothetical protein
MKHVICYLKSVPQEVSQHEMNQAPQIHSLHFDLHDAP